MDVIYKAFSKPFDITQSLNTSQSETLFFFFSPNNARLEI